MVLLQLVDIVGMPFRLEPISRKEVGAVFCAALNLFTRWSVTDEQAALLTTMLVSTYRRWKAEGAGHLSRDGLAACPIL